MNLGNKLELFVDKYLIDKMDRTQLRLGVPQSKGAVMTFGHPTAPGEGIHPYYFTVIQDGDTFKMWYRWQDAEKRGEIGVKDGFTNECTCYAESKDGIHWVRPDLGLFEFLGSRHNNAVLADAAPASADFHPFLDTRPGVPESERFKATGGMGSNMNCFRKGWLPMERSGIHGFVSPDGIHWKHVQKERIYDDATRVFDGMNQCFWSEAEQCYVMYYRQHTVRDTEVIVDSIVHRREYAKTVARTTSPDFIHWDGRHMLDWGGRAPTDKECIYCNALKPYYRAPHLYLGLATRFMQGRVALNNDQCIPMDDALENAGWQRPSKWWNPDSMESWLKDDCNDVCILTSRGGNKVDRTFCESFIRPGIGYENWTSRTNHPAYGQLLTAPNELSIYVLRRYAQADPYLERLTIRPDGFASVNAPYDGGEMVTKAFTFSGKELVINHATGAPGYVRVEILEAKDDKDPGRPIPGFALEDCPEIIGDEIERVVRWKNGPDVSQLAGQNIRLRFVMKDADLYSIRFK